ncbi:MAG TPA: hypothetical protein VLJ88_07825 [Propionibacteriaceae bacterium]|nr:hypothetical protein [Propionibacteriaceae bacterium]
MNQDQVHPNLTVHLTYDLRVERATKSKVYLQQSAGDPLVIALVR